MRWMKMLNPDGIPGSGSYIDLRGRILRRLRSAKIKDQVLEIAQNAYEKALASDNLVLSRAERKRLKADVLKSIFAEMNKQLDES
jgi:hypothetical protein